MHLLLLLVSGATICRARAKRRSILRTLPAVRFHCSTFAIRSRIVLLTPKQKGGRETATMKQLAIITLTLGISILIGRAWNARAHSLHAADEEFARNEHDLATSAGTAAAKAKDLQDHLGSPTLPKDVDEFRTTTRHLEHLRDDLQATIDRLDAATNRALIAFDRERAAVTDPGARRALTTLRAQARNETVKRLMSARRALRLLSRLLIEGRDVAHAATCVLLADDLNASADALTRRTRAATEQTTTYQHLTDDLLNRLASTYAE
jgi:hypothetical protein